MEVNDKMYKVMQFGKGTKTLSWNYKMCSVLILKHEKKTVNEVFPELQIGKIIGET